MQSLLNFEKKNFNVLKHYKHLNKNTKILETLRNIQPYKPKVKGSYTRNILYRMFYLMPTLYAYNYLVSRFKRKDVCSICGREYIVLNNNSKNICSTCATALLVPKHFYQIYANEMETVDSFLGNISLLKKATDMYLNWSRTEEVKEKTKYVSKTNKAFLKSIFAFNTTLAVFVEYTIDALGERKGVGKKFRDYEIELLNFNRKPFIKHFSYLNKYKFNYLEGLVALLLRDFSLKPQAPNYVYDKIYLYVTDKTRVLAPINQYSSAANIIETNKDFSNIIIQHINKLTNTIKFEDFGDDYGVDIRFNKNNDAKGEEILAKLFGCV